MLTNLQAEARRAHNLRHPEVSRSKLEPARNLFFLLLACVLGWRHKSSVVRWIRVVKEDTKFTSKFLNFTGSLDRNWLQLRLLISLFFLLFT